MRHHDNKRKFHREKKVRVALMKSLALGLIENGKIKTTEAKAKELRPFVEKMVTTAKKGDRRNLISKIGSLGATKLVKEISPKYSTRTSGYTRITKLPARVSDGSLMAVIEFV